LQFSVSRGRNTRKNVSSPRPPRVPCSWSCRSCASVTGRTACPGINRMRVSGAAAGHARTQAPRASQSIPSNLHLFASPSNGGIIFDHFANRAFGRNPRLSFLRMCPSHWQLACDPASARLCVMCLVSSLVFATRGCCGSVRPIRVAVRVCAANGSCLPLIASHCPAPAPSACACYRLCVSGGPSRARARDRDLTIDRWKSRRKSIDIVWAPGYSLSGVAARSGAGHGRCR
jgi:hypothetical protein